MNKKMRAGEDRSTVSSKLISNRGDYCLYIYIGYILFLCTFYKKILLVI